MNQSTKGIQCKIIYKDQIRRFQFSGTEFSSLQDQVQRLFGLNREFVLKYKDNEEDMITISSNEELACATDFSQKDDGGLLRLTVYLPGPSAPSPVPSFLDPIPPEHGKNFCHPPIHPFHPPEHGQNFCHLPMPPPVHPLEHGQNFFHPPGPPPIHPLEHGQNFFHPPGPPPVHPLEHGQNFFHPPGPPPIHPLGHGQNFCYHLPIHPEHGRNFCNRGHRYGGRWGGGCREGVAHRGEHPCRKHSEKRREKLTFKRDMWKARLDSLDQKTELTPEEETRKLMLKAMVQCLDSILVEFSPQNRYPGNFCPPTCEKSQKWHREGRKKEPKNSYLSEEAKAEIRTLKSQIKEMKPTIWTIQQQLKFKRSAFQDACETGQREKIPELKNEIRKLKEERKAKKELIEPLRQRVRQLKVGSQ